MSEEKANKDIREREESKQDDHSEVRDCCCVVDVCGCYADPCCCTPSVVYCR